MAERPRPLLILGARTFAPVVADLLASAPEYQVAAFVENLDQSRCSAKLEGLPVLWVDEIAQLADTHSAICALGSTKRKALIEQAAEAGFRFATFVDSAASVSRKATVGEGSIVSTGAVVAAHSTIGKHVLVNRGALIGHNVEIGDYVTIGPGANIAGFTRIKSGAHIGMGANILEKRSIDESSVVAAGALVNSDVAARTMVAGAPARVVKTNVDGL